MTINLKAMWKAILDAPTGHPDGLHWRDDELWCGPLRLGRTHHANEDGEDYHFGYIETPGVREVDSTSKVECRAALDAAAREQIAAAIRAAGEE